MLIGVKTHLTLPDRGNAPSLQACNKVAKDVSCAGLSRFLRHGIQTSKTPAAAAGGGSDTRLTLESEVLLGAGAGFGRYLTPRLIFAA